MGRCSDAEGSAERERRLIESARHEAQALGEARGPHALPVDSIPGYTILHEIGRGGMGVVYKARQLSPERTVALKVMLAGPFASASIRRRFDREVELAARLQHPNIVRVLESGESPSGQPFYTMDYVVGIPLDRHLAAVGPDTRTVLALFERVCVAVEYAHRRGVIHRDLKPGNVLINDAGAPHLLDFGLAKATEHSDAEQTRILSVSAPGQVLGTLGYLSPEQAAGRRDEVDARTDVYAVGVMLYQALTGSVPFSTTGHPSAVLQRILEASPPPPSSLSDRVDGELQTIILKALEKDRAQRYPSAQALGDDLRRYLDGRPISARPPTSFYVLRKKVQRHRLRIALVAAAVMLGLIGLVGGFWWKDRALARQRVRDLADGRHVVLLIQQDLDGGRVERCIGTAEAASKNYPELPEAQLLWRHAEFTAGRRLGDESLMMDAIAGLKEALRRDPSWWGYRALLAEMYAIVDDAQAEELAARADAEMPDTAEAWYLRSFATFDTGIARRCAKQALQRDRRHGLAWARLAHLCARSGDFETALDAAHRLIDLSDNPGSWMMFEGHVLTACGRYREAVERSTELVPLMPNASEPYRCRALARLCLKQYARAIEDYDMTVTLDPDQGWNHCHRATVHWIVGHLAAAAADYLDFVRLRGHSFYADARLFLVLREQARQLIGQEREGDAQQPLTAANDALTAARGGAIPGSWLEAIFRSLSGELTPAELVGTADEDQPEQLCEAYYYAGEVCLLDERIEEAREWFRKCVDTGLVLDQDQFPPNPMSEYHLARWRLDSLSTRSTASSTADRG